MHPQKVGYQCRLIVRIPFKLTRFIFAIVNRTFVRRFKNRSSVNNIVKDYCYQYLNDNFDIDVNKFDILLSYIIRH